MKKHFEILDGLRGIAALSVVTLISSSVFLDLLSAMPMTIA